MMWLKHQTNDARAESFLEAVTAFNLSIFPKEVSGELGNGKVERKTLNCFQN